MGINVAVVCAYVVLLMSGAGFGCNQHKTCETCSVSTRFFASCRWCPLSKACHAYGSIYNPCTSKQYITDAKKCYDLTPGKYQPDSAYVNTLMSTVAYTDEPKQCLDRIYPKNDFEIIEAIGKRCEKLSLFPYKECFAYTAVSHASKVITLTFRGTFLTIQLVDQVISILTLPKVSFESGGHVQSYFKTAFDALFPCAKQSVVDLMKKYPDYQLVITGHSLGGSIASLAALSLAYSKVVPKEKLSLYTFGMPRVGDKTYAITHDRLVNNSWRLVHHRDIIAHLPTCDIILGCYLSSSTPFHHGIEVFYPESIMSVNSSYKLCLKNEDSSCSNGIIISQPCIFDIGDCVMNHHEYFGINVGNECVPSARSGISAKDPDFRTKYWDMLNEDTCTRVDANTLKVIS